MTSDSAIDSRIQVLLIDDDAHLRQALSQTLDLAGLKVLSLGDAQGLAAALNHSAFNFANALGPLLGGMAIAHGLGWTSTGPVGSVLALGGLALLLASVRLDRTRRGPLRPARA